ncbi:putative unusual protein kinase regulating ubiquinone biosynthesis (AarF/ABC1/UbiB family) [Shimia isoporae]|uniref:Putative unusual protein kinase regulating ubiquinone biosynthesis (AarF/ABC1/UbiB family) n=2 Tax=Shimia isoporae TaxID=647720 RepID=A0A4R1N2X1_9RHOB|nr:putative unusual protein kinase regulating ubiquinone biosynthesis (AarF/ABC1/UbiB family) [Shimia isoporae]
MSVFRTTPRASNVPSGRLTRLALLGTMTTSVAGNMAVAGLREAARGKKLDAKDLLLTPSNIRRIADDLARMRGAAMKIGQLLSMDTGDILPPELNQIMARLRADADYMPPKQLKTVLNKSWGDKWLRQFERFDVRPVAAASIGQVHRAKTRDGRDMAIKVQYPGVARSIDSDVANVAALIRVSGLIPKGFELKPYMEEARRQLHEEADYEREGQFLQSFRRLLRDDNAFVVPELHADYTTKHVLAMSFVTSHPIEDAFKLDQKQRNQITENLVTLLLRELFEFGLMQTDPNFANYRFDPITGRIVLLDFGATRRFQSKIVDQYRRLFQFGIAGDSEGLRAIALEIGFIVPETEAHHQQALLDMIEMAFTAFRDQEAFNFGNTVLVQKMNNAANALAADGFVPPPVPMDVLYLQRKFGGMFLLANRLKAHLPITEIVRRFVPI